jgi:hypothetical protein
MKKLYLLLAFAILGFYTQAQTVVFTDDFESGITNWTTTGSWGISSSQSNSPTHSLSESPSGNYSNNWNTFCTMTNGVDLSTYPSASLSFWGTYKIEGGFDYMYIEVSTDNFATFTTIATFSGNESVPLPAFQQYTYDLGGFCGNSNVKVRFHFYSDAGYTTDGMYIDDFTITASTIDNSAPLIVHTPAPFYEGTLNNKVVDAQIIDFSGVNINNTYLEYTVDGGSAQQVSAVLVSGNQYQFTIPAQTPGALVQYFIHAEDNYSTPNVATSPNYEYISGNHIIQDNGVVDYFMQVGPGVTTGPSEGVAVKIALGGTDLVGMLLRNYTDIDHPNDSMLIHVWDDNNGVPGNDVITPFMTYPAANLTNTSAMKWIDLRPYAAQLTNLSGTYYIGFTVPSGIVNITISQPGTYARSYVKTSTGWSASSGTNGANDHHFRAITSLNQDIEGPNIVNNTIPVHYESGLSAQTVNATITDMSGVASSTLYYKVDNGSIQSITGVNQSGSSWNYIIPAQTPGAFVKYWIEATDVVTPTPYTSHTDTFTYISGLYHKFDNNQPDVYIPIGTLAQNYAGIAEMLDFQTSTTQLTTVLIRNYYSTSTPSNTPNDPMTIHVWSNNNGLPGTDLITPFVVNSEANASNPLAVTKVDLRSYSAQLSNLTGVVFVGFTVSSGSCAVLGEQNGTYGHTFANDGTQWIPDQTDAQIRAITGPLSVSASTVDLNNIIDIYPNPTSDLVNIYIDNFEQSIVNIYSMDGKIIKTFVPNTNNTLINTNKWEKGMYIIKIQHQKGISSHKLIVK